ncbi:MAG TPA: agmatinase [Nitrococcus sp.]|nr:agmatinase [Nitrococcus sp.]
MTAMAEARYQLLPNRSLDATDVMVLPVPYEHTVSYRPGTAQAPAAILAATAQLEYYDEDQRWSPFKHMGVTVLPSHEKRPHESEHDFHRRLKQYVASLPSQPLLLALGGEHSITPALIQGRMDAPGTVVLLDAHADLRREFEGTRFSHACPMHHVREAGHEILMAGVRSLLDEEAARIDADPGIHCFMDRELQRSERWQALLDALNALSGSIWLTIDMDVFDPAAVPGVGTPQPGGLSWYQALAIIEACLFNQRVVLRGCDLVELVPESSRVSDMTAAKLSHKLISCWGKSQQLDKRPVQGSQTEVDYH